MRTRKGTNLIAVGIALFVGSVVGCLPSRDMARTPIQVVRTLPITVKKDAWPAIVKTLLLQGDVIKTVERTLEQVTFRRAVTMESLPVLCDLDTIQSLDPDSWQFAAGAIEISIWLDHETDGNTSQLKMEGRCRVIFDPPKSRTLLAPWFLSIPAAIATRGQIFKRQSVVFASKGELERKLQAQIVTTLGLDLPAWLMKQ